LQLFGYIDSVTNLDMKQISQELIDKMADNGVLAMRLGPGKHLHGRNLMDGAVDGKEFDYFHDMIIGQELARPAARGFQVSRGNRLQEL
jgi:hypothetical protein